MLKLTGPKALTYDDMAAELARALGKPVAHQRLDEQSLRAQMEPSGMPGWMIDSFLGMQRLIRDDQLSLVTGVVESVLGRPPRSFGQWLAENKGAFAA